MRPTKDVVFGEGDVRDMEEWRTEGVRRMSRCGGSEAIALVGCPMIIPRDLVFIPYPFRRDTLFTSSHGSTLTPIRL